MFVDTPLSNTKIDICYLDNTYFNKKFLNIPSREKALKEIIALICFKREQIKNVIFHLNLRILGKENLLEDLYDHFKIPILVSKKRYERIVNILELNKEYFTTEYKQNTLIFVTDLNEEMPNFAENKSIIFIEPTALQMSYTSRENKSFEDLYSDPNEKYFVIPYTDHSSYSEIIEFVKKLKPKLIIPIVRKALPGDLATSDLTELNKYLSKELLVDCHDKYRLLLRNSATLRRSSRLHMIQLPAKKTNNPRKIVNSLLNVRKTKIIKRIEYESDNSQSQSQSQEKNEESVDKTTSLNTINEESESKIEENVIVRRSTRLSYSNIENKQSIVKDTEQKQSNTIWTKLNDQVDIMEVETNSATENTESDSNDTQNDAEPMNDSQSVKKEDKLKVKKATSAATIMTSEEDFTTPLSSPVRKESEDLITSDLSSPIGSIEIDDTLQVHLNENENQEHMEKVNTESTNNYKKLDQKNESVLKLKNQINVEKKNTQKSAESVQNSQPILVKQNDDRKLKQIKSISFEEFYQRKQTKEETLCFFNFMNERLDKVGVVLDENILNKNIIDCIFNTFKY
jgi:hypothetical protein